MGKHSRTKGQRITITLPWPPAKTSPNASKQGNWRGKSGAAKAYKNECIKCCWEQKVPKVDAETVSTFVTFYAPPRAHTYDLDNLLARTKQGLDAVAEAIGIDDAKWSDMHLMRGESVKGGCVVVHIIPPVVEVELRGAIS